MNRLKLLKKIIILSLFIIIILMPNTAKATFYYNDYTRKGNAYIMRDSTLTEVRNKLGERVIQNNEDTNFYWPGSDYARYVMGYSNVQCLDAHTRWKLCCKPTKYNT